MAAGTPHNKATAAAKNALVGVKTALFNRVSTVFSLKSGNKTLNHCEP
jgi:hypothetical protein